MGLRNDTLFCVSIYKLAVEHIFNVAIHCLLNLDMFAAPHMVVEDEIDFDSILYDS